MEVEMKIRGLMMDPVTNMPISSSGQNREARIPKRSTGADRLVGAMKAL
jgi:hypothetical protein